VPANAAEVYTTTLPTIAGMPSTYAQVSMWSANDVCGYTNESLIVEHAVHARPHWQHSTLVQLLPLASLFAGSVR
jgi:hypothetical protein